jgi:hypothetical protein
MGEKIFFAKLYLENGVPTKLKAGDQIHVSYVSGKVFIHFERKQKRLFVREKDAREECGGIFILPLDSDKFTSIITEQIVRVISTTHNLGAKFLNWNGITPTAGETSYRYQLTSLND